MVNTSKILTVSYGTFSCTLEGFDDSFDTMKAIAEYFRDLAADDRYFGAEPPTPDAEMLARIAEREIERRVEAREDQGKIVLRAADAPALAATTALAQAPEHEVEEPAADVEAPEEEVVSAEPVAEVAEEPVADAPVVEDLAVEEPTAEVLAADEAGVEESEVEPVEDDPRDDHDVVSDGVETAEETAVEAVSEEPFHGVEALAGDDAAADMIEAADDQSSDVASDKDVIESAEEFFANSPEPETEVYYEPEAVEEMSALPDPDSVAAKLSRIRSVVSQSGQAEDQDDFSEDEHAQDFLNEAAADLDAALAQDDEAEIEQQSEDAAHDGLSDADILASLAGSSVGAPDEEAAFAAPSEDAGADTDDDDGLPDTLSQLLEDSIVDAEADDVVEGDVAADEVPALEDTEEPLDMVSEAPDDVASIDEDAPVALEETPEDMGGDLNARVIKMKREDVEGLGGASDDADLDMNGEDAMQAVEDDVAEGDHFLSPEDEEELQRELAEVDADLEADSDEADAAMADTADAEVEADQAESDETDHAADEPVVAREGRAKFESADDQSDLERIFDEADSQLEKPESNQRRSAIQHLRAAVAATRAEKKAGTDLQKDVDDSPYRSDLASVVRPRRPNAAEGTRSERPAESRPAPLKLVAEQRIDTAREPIRPRRVSAAELNAASEANKEESGSSFSEFAQEMGATQLPDLLEAAAAYMSDVEGRAQFSRPMLMHKLQEVEKGNFSREDGLRSFGQLLRDGKIQKIKGGRFTVTEETEFRGEDRHAG